MTWLDEMIARQSIPSVLREGTVEDFCIKHGIDRSTYYYQLSKKENQEKVLELSLNQAKNVVPDILDKLAQNALAGKEKSIEMYLDYVLKLAKNLDIKSDGKPIIQIASEVALKHDLQKENL